MIRYLPFLLIVVLAADGSAASTVTDIVSEDHARFSALLNSPAAERRIEGIQGLSQMKSWESEPRLVSLVNDTNAAVCREALLALTRAGTAASIPVLLAALTNADWELRENARLALPRMTGHEWVGDSAAEWRSWWVGSSLAEKQRQLLATVKAVHTNFPPAQPELVLRRGKRVRPLPASVSPPACAERREALRALRQLADATLAGELAALLARPQSPPLDPDERAFICEALERVGDSNAVQVLAAQRSDAAAWALGRIGGTQAEQALLKFPPSLPTLLAVDRVHSTNVAGLIPLLVQSMGQITYRSQPDDVMNDELQPIQRVGVSLIRRSGLASVFTEAVLQQLENTMKPPIQHGVAPSILESWQPLLTRMQSELKPGFVREDGVTTSQPAVTLCYLVEDPALAPRLLPLLNHPAVVVRVYVALALGRLHATQALPALTNMIAAGYSFSDSTALASGKHFDHSQTVRWKGFLCMALGRMGGDEARLALERFALDPAQTRDVRYSSVVGLRFISSPTSLPVLRRVAEQDLIWMVRDEARRVCERIELLAQEH